MSTWVVFVRKSDRRLHYYSHTHLASIFFFRPIKVFFTPNKLPLGINALEADTKKDLQILLAILSFFLLYLFFIVCTKRDTLNYTVKVTILYWFLIDGNSRWIHCALINNINSCECAVWEVQGGGTSISIVLILAFLLLICVGECNNSSQKR